MGTGLYHSVSSPKCSMPRVWLYYGYVVCFGFSTGCDSALEVAICRFYALAEVVVDTE